MLKLSPRRAWIAAGAGAVALFSVIAVAFCTGPAPAAWVRDAAERALEAQVEGGRATVRTARFVSFAEAGAWGVRLDGVRLVDGRGRDVIRAARLEAGVSIDGLAQLTPALGRAAAQDFFVAVSVSPQGRYALGYEARGGDQTAGGLDGLFEDVTGRARAGRPLSWLRQIDMRSGRIALRQVEGAVAWTGEVRRLRFDKVGGRLEADADLSLTSAGASVPAVLTASARGDVGLSDAKVTARVEGLRPARVFPSVGATAPLSVLDAPVRGRGAVSYGLKTGFRTGDAWFEAGRGELRIAGSGRAFEAAELRATYRPETRSLSLDRVRLASDRARFDLTGAVRVAPRNARTRSPASVGFELRGASLTAALAGDARPQSLQDVSARGRYIPERRRWEIDEAKARLGAASVTLSAAADRDRKGDLGLTLNARGTGALDQEAVFAFWPEALVRETRTWLRGSVLAGSFVDPVVVIDAPDGALGRPVLKNEAMDIRFAFRSAAVRFDRAFPAVENGAGTAKVSGNRFDLTLTSGRIGEAALSEGAIAIPRFKPGGAPAVFKARATGPVDGMLRVIDGPDLRLVSDAGLPPARAGGQADVRLEIVRPMLLNVPVEDYRIRYAGTISGGRLSDAALGWDLDRGALRLEGDAEGLRVWGAGFVGPYAGTFDYRNRFEGEDRLQIDGTVLASAVGGLPGLKAPFRADFLMDQGRGAGRVRSSLFEGRASWIDTPREGQFLLQGTSFARALAAVQAPFAKSLPARTPTRLSLARAGDVWRGEMMADALSGALSFTPGDRSRLIYRAEVTPQEARRLGLGGLPLFALARPVVVDTVWGERDGVASVGLGPIVAQVTWADRADGGPGERRMRASLDRAHLALVGVPDLLRPAGDTPVEAFWRTDANGADMTLAVSGVPIRMRTDRDGQTVATAILDADALERLGVEIPFRLAGAGSVTARWRTGEADDIAGTVDADLTGAEVRLPKKLWSKEAGRPGRLSFAFARTPGGAMAMTRVTVQAEGLDLFGGATVAADGRLALLDFARVRLADVYEGAASFSEAGGARTLTLRGRRLDVSRLLQAEAEADGARLADVRRAEPEDPLRLDLAVDVLRIGKAARLQDVKASGVLGAQAVQRLDLTARTIGAATLRASLTPGARGSTLRAETADAGAAAQALFGLTSLKGGKAVVSGRLVSGGADLDLDARDVRLVKAPTMAQILTMGSLDGLADTLNGEGVRFARVVAPLQLRGSTVRVGEARATGSALGFTTQGVADFERQTLDFEGTLAPAYALNSAIGAVPVLGQVLVSREGEGVVGLGWSAKGALDKPRVAVNPLSLVTPGVLRRIFETAPGAREAPAGR